MKLKSKTYPATAIKFLKRRRDPVQRRDNLKPKLGFTVIELLIVMAMTTIIATLVLADFRKGEKQKRVSIASDTIISALSLAQNYALSGKNISGSTCSAGHAPQAYITYLSASGTLTLWGLDNCDRATLIESFAYPTNVQIKADGYQLNPGGSGFSPAPALKFKFSPPFGKLTASTTITTPESGPFNSFAKATITVESNDGSGSKTVTVDGVAGRVE